MCWCLKRCRSEREKANTKSERRLVLGDWSGGDKERSWQTQHSKQTGFICAKYPKLGACTKRRYLERVASSQSTARPSEKRFSNQHLGQRWPLSWDVESENGWRIVFMRGNKLEAERTQAYRQAPAYSSCLWENRRRSQVPLWIAWGGTDVTLAESLFLT